MSACSRDPKADEASTGPKELSTDISALCLLHDPREQKFSTFLTLWPKKLKRQLLWPNVPNLHFIPHPISPNRLQIISRVTIFLKSKAGTPVNKKKLCSQKVPKSKLRCQKKVFTSNQFPISSFYEKGVFLKSISFSRCFLFRNHFFNKNFET